jgi:hypothetical protein
MQLQLVGCPAAPGETSTARAEPYRSESGAYLPWPLPYLCLTKLSQVPHGLLAARFSNQKSKMTTERKNKALAAFFRKRFARSAETQRTTEKSRSVAPLITRKIFFVFIKRVEVEVPRVLPGQDALRRVRAASCRASHYWRHAPRVSSRGKLPHKAMLVDAKLPLNRPLLAGGSPRLSRAASGGAAERE